MWLQRPEDDHSNGHVDVLPGRGPPHRLQPLRQPGLPAPEPWRVSHVTSFLFKGMVPLNMTEYIIKGIVSKIKTEYGVIMQCDSITDHAQILHQMDSLTSQDKIHH